MPPLRCVPHTIHVLYACQPFDVQRNFELRPSIPPTASPTARFACRGEAPASPQPAPIRQPRPIGAARNAGDQRPDGLFSLSHGCAGPRQRGQKGARRPSRGAAGRSGVAKQAAGKKFVQGAIRRIPGAESQRQSDGNRSKRMDLRRSRRGGKPRTALAASSRMANGATAISSDALDRRLETGQSTWQRRSRIAGAGGVGQTELNFGRGSFCRRTLSTD